MKSMSFADKVFTFTEKHTLFSAPCHLLVAVSGGPDSMALLYTLIHWPQMGLQISVVHMNHGLRGKTAQRDEDFVRQFCADAHIPLTVLREDVVDYAKTHALTLEEAGRELRYQRFEQLRQTLHADWLVTAHTASDQVETMLMHLVRGCGLDALRGIPAKRDRICRPLLSCTREEVLTYCRDYAIPYVVDETNEDTRFTRNRIRHEVLPLLQTINPSVERSFLRFQDHLSEDVAFLDKLAHDLLSSAKEGETIQIAPLADAPQPLRRRAIRLLLRQHQLNTIEETHICALEQLILSGCGKTLLPDFHSSQVYNGRLTIRAQGNEPSVNPLFLPVHALPFSFTAGQTRYTLSLMEISDYKNVHNLFFSCAIDYDKIQGELIVRTRAVGDTLHPAGRSLGKSLKKLMNEWKIPTELRDSFPLLCDASGVLFVPGYACDQRASVTEHTTRCLIIQAD